MYYYAFYHTYGINMRLADNSPVGILHIFSSRRARDMWVRDEQHEYGNAHRTVLGSREARKIIVEFVAIETFDYPFYVDVMYDINELISEARKYLPSEDVVRQFGFYGPLYIHEEA